jgi:outer membrane immunogenic protein
LVAGGQVGYNFQFGASPFVFGIEGDGDWSGISGSGACAPGVFLNCSQSNNLRWMADVTGRVGYAVGGFLPYAKGGIAWGDWSHDFNIGNGAVTGNQSDVQNGLVNGRWF